MFPSQALKRELDYEKKLSVKQENRHISDTKSQVMLVCSGEKDL